MDDQTKEIIQSLLDMNTSQRNHIAMLEANSSINNFVIINILTKINLFDDVHPDMIALYERFKSTSNLLIENFGDASESGPIIDILDKQIYQNT